MVVSIDNFSVISLSIFGCELLEPFKNIFLNIAFLFVLLNSFNIISTSFIITLISRLLIGKYFSLLIIASSNVITSSSKSSNKIGNSLIAASFLIKIGPCLL